MNTDIEAPQDTFKHAYETFRESREEYQEILDLYHNRGYELHIRATLKARGQPEETYNIILQFANLLMSYYDTVSNTVRALPKHPDDAVSARVA